MGALKAHRSGFYPVKSNVAGCTTIKSPVLPGEEITLIWGDESETKKVGTSQKVMLHEVWVFNSEGKVCRFFQYAIPVLGKK